eukprot:7021966-Alexandrium_andersonii.AAC.1
MAVLTLQAHSTRHSVQVIHGASLRRAATDAPVTKRRPWRRHIRSCSCTRNATRSAEQSAYAPRQW